MAKTSFYSGSGATSNDVDAVDSLKTAAENAKTAAETAQAAAETAEANAETSATNAASSATSGSTSASTATTKASEAAASASTATTKASEAATSASTATTKASEAATSASSASTSASTATTKASEAATSATNAATSETNAASSATSASTSASTATTKASEAATSATNASTSASTATTKASEASTSASTATTKASEAATSATNAANSATAAAASAAAAAASADTFDDTYLGSKSSDPSTDNDGDALNAGDLYFNTSSNTLKVYSGSAWQDAAIDSSGFAQTTGDTMTGNLSFGDNVKATFGDGDLQIYHDGSNSYISDQGTNDLKVLATDFQLKNAADTEFMITAVTNGAVNLYFDNSSKLATRSTGADITGTLTADGLNVNSGTSNVVATLESTDSVAAIQLKDNAGEAEIGAIGNDVGFYPAGVEKMRLTSSGSLGVGTSSPDKKLDVDTTMRVRNAAGSSAAELDVTSGSTWRLRSNPTSGTNSYGLDFIKGSGGTDVKMALNSSGYLGVGTSSPQQMLHVNGGAADTTIQITNSASGSAATDGFSLTVENPSADVNIRNRESSNMRFYTGNSERLRIDSSGRLGLKTSANASFDQVAGADLFVLGSGAGDQGMTIYSGNAGTGNIMFADGTTTTNQYEGYIQYVHADNRMLFGSNHSTRMTIDSSGRVIMGTATDSNAHSNADNLIIGNAPASGVNAGITIVSGDNANGAIHFSDGTSSGNANIQGQLVYEHTNNAFSFYTAASEAMRLTSDGTLLAGDTSATFNDTAKTVIRPSSDNWTIKPAVVHSFNRTGSDGDILEFYRTSSTKVGSIGTSNGDLTIGTTDVAVRFSDSDNQIYPINISTRAAVDAATTLGNPAARFKDLYLSGGVYLGGTGASNKLEDYEEGTFNATATSSGSATLSVTDELYTKIGRIVHVSFTVNFSGSGNSGNLIVDNLPFSAVSTAPIGIGREDATNGYAVFGRITSGTDDVDIWSADSASNATPFKVAAGNIRFSITYKCE